MGISERVEFFFIACLYVHTVPAGRSKFFVLSIIYTPLLAVFCPLAINVPAWSSLLAARGEVGLG